MRIESLRKIAQSKVSTNRRITVSDLFGVAGGYKPTTDLASTSNAVSPKKMLYLRDIIHAIVDSKPKTVASKKPQSTQIVLR